MTYQERLTTAMRRMPILPKSVNHAHIEHDDWCGINYGKPCSCDPNIFVVTPDGTYDIGQQGTPRLRGTSEN